MIGWRTGARGMRSILRQALVLTVSVEALCLLSLAGVSIWHEARVQLGSVDVLLEGRADSLFGAVQDAEDQADTLRVDPREALSTTGDVFAVFDVSGRRISVSDDAPEALTTEPGAEGTKTQRIGKELYRVLRQRRLRIIDREETGGIGLNRPVEIVYAMRIGWIWKEIFRATGFFLFASLALIALATSLMLILLRSLLRPVGELAVAAESVSLKDLRFVPPASALRTAELLPLAGALTAMVGGLRDAIDRQHRFLGDAAHELKTGVAVVRSTLQVLLLRSRSEIEYAEGVAQAVQDNEQVEDLVLKMLLLARLEESTSFPQKQAEVVAVLVSVVEGLRSVAERAGVRLLTPTYEGADKVRVSIAPTDLGVLLRNLVVNAIEHSGPGSAVRVGVERRAESVTVTVTDDGCGIPEDALPHIFERFYRVDVSRARATGGAGLGLSIAKAIVETGGGSIEVTSRVGEGTKMTVRMPLAV